MTAQLLTRKWRIIILVAVSVLIAFIGIPLLFINAYLTPKLSGKLKNAVLTSSDSLYHISFSKAELHVLKGKGILYDIVLTPDTAVYHRMQAQGKAPAELYELRVKQLLINDAHPFKLYFHKQLEIGQIILANPEVRVSQYKLNDKQPKPKDDRTLYQKLSKSLHSIHVGFIDLDDIRFTYQTFTGPKAETGALKHMNLKVTDLLIDSATQYDRSRTLFCKEIETRLENFNGTTADGLYQFKIRSMHLSTSTSCLTVTGLAMLPLPANIFFTKSQSDRFTVYLDSVSISDINFQSLKLRPNFDVTKLAVYKGRFDIYPNPNTPPNKSNKRITFPNWLLGHMKSVLNIDTFDFKHLNISYTEYNKETGQAGTVSFDNTTGRFLHISNKKENVTMHPRSTVYLTTYVMGKAKFDLNVGFNLNDSSLRYHYMGHLGPVDLKVGNVALVPLGLVKAQSGDIQSLDFNINASQKTATGKLTLLYHNLKAELLRHNADGYHKKALLTLAANLIVLKHNNPDSGQTAPRVATVAYVRPINVPFFESMWLTVLSGIKSCAEVGKADKAPDKTPAQPKTRKEIRQEKRALRKAKRAAKKEEKKAEKEQKK